MAYQAGDLRGLAQMQEEGSGKFVWQKLQLRTMHLNNYVNARNRIVSRINNQSTAHLPLDRQSVNRWFHHSSQGFLVCEHTCNIMYSRL